MKTFKEKIQESASSFATIVDLGRDGSDPEVLDHGYGKMLYSQLKDKIARDMQALTNYAKSDNMNNVRNGITGITLTMVSAALDIQSQLQDPTIKRKITLLRKK